MILYNFHSYCAFDIFISECRCIGTSLGRPHICLAYGALKGFFRMFILYKLIVLTTIFHWGFCYNSFFWLVRQAGFCEYKNINSTTNTRLFRRRSLVWL